jgi:hypothetical protein
VTTPFAQPRTLPKTQVEYDFDLREAWMKVREARHDLSRIVSAVSTLVANSTVKLNEADADLAALMAVDRAKLPHDTA